MTSATYRQASQESEQFEENKKADPDNLVLESVSSATS